MSGVRPFGNVINWLPRTADLPSNPITIFTRTCTFRPIPPWPSAAVCG